MTTAMLAAAAPTASAGAVAGERPRVTAKVIKYELRDVVRSRALLAYAAFFLVTGDALLRFGGADPRALLGLMNVVLLVIPLVAVVFGTMYVYHAREFVELLLAQPVGRRQLFAGLYLGLALPLAAAFALGLAIPVTIHGAWAPALRGTVLTLLGIGVVLTMVFTAIALVIAVRVEDRVRGLGLAVALWLGAAVLYDGVVLLVATMFAAYPLERPMLGLMLANPVDLARVVLLLRFDVAALMGYTGAVFQRFFGSAGGAALAAGALALWIAVPIWVGARAFQRKDF